MRLLLFSNAPHCGTGYGVQTALLAKRLQSAGHDVAVLAYFGLEGGMLQWEGIPVFPRTRHLASQDWMVPLARQMQADAIIAITDPWVVETRRFAGTDIAYLPWFPCDGEPMDGPNAAGISGPGPVVRLPIATSEHAAAMARASGITDLRVIPYAVDTDAYCPGDRVEAREAWNIPQDAFAVGIVAMNKHAAGIDRKRFFEQIGAFARLRAEHDDALLYMHTHVVAPDGVAIREMLEHHKVPLTEVMFTEGAVLTLGAPAERMADLYRSFDVLLGCTGGEGAGVPLLEAAACGTPAIWGDWTAMPEYAKAGWSVSRDEAQQQMNAGRVMWWTPRIEAIADRLERAYSATEGERKALAETARAGALQHGADLLYRERWAPALIEVEERIRDAKQVTSVPVPECLRPSVGAAA